MNQPTPVVPVGPAVTHRYLTDDEKRVEVARWLAYRSDPENLAPPGHEGGYGYPDPAIFPLTDALNALPGVMTDQSCAGHILTDNRDGTPYHQPGQLWLRLSEPMMARFTAEAYRLYEAPTIERIQRIFHKDVGDVVDIVFHGNERGKLAESSAVIARFFTDLAGQEGLTDDHLPPDHFCPDWVVAPGETIRDIMAENHLSERVFARAIRIPPEDAAALLRGDLPLTDDLAGRLSRLFGPSVTFWLNLERNYRAGPCRQSHTGHQERQTDDC